MKNFLKNFFAVLGVIFFILLCVLAYLWFADPFGVRPLITMITADTPSSAVGAPIVDGKKEDVSVDTAVDKHPALSSQQEEALESIGINPANLPSSISPEMEACFLGILGSARVAEIKSGASPTPAEVFSTRSCYQ